MLKKTSQEPLGQFQPNLAGNMLGGWGFRFVQIKGLINLQKCSSHEPPAGMH